MSVDEFLELLRFEREVAGYACCNKMAYSCWSEIFKLDPELEEIGRFDHAEECINRNGYESWLPGENNYWSVSAPIALAYYPYHESTVFRCKKCAAVFLYYIEQGGHSPSQRLRWARANLVHWEPE